MLKVFNGGLQCRLEPNLIPKNTGVIYDNIDNVKGALVPIKNPKDSSYSSLYNHWWYFKYADKICTNLGDAYMVEYNKHMYIAKADDTIKEADNNCNLIEVTLPRPNGIITLDGSTEAGDFNGTYSYTYTYYNSTTGKESAPILHPSEELTFTGNAIRVIILSTDTIPDTVDKIRLYRIGGTVVNYSLVTEITIDHTNNSYTYIDQLSDTELAGNHVLDTYGNEIPVSGLVNLTLHNVMLFASKDNKLYFSNVGNPAAWPAENYIEYPNKITGIGSSHQGLFVFLENAYYLVTGNAPEVLSSHIIDNEIGCLNHHTIKYVNNGLMWVCADGIAYAASLVAKVISFDKLDKVKLDVQNANSNATVANGNYYLSILTPKYPKDKDQHPGGQLIVVDSRAETIIRTMNISGWLGTIKGEPYINDNLDNSQVIKQLEAADTYSELEFHSGILTGADYARFKIAKYVKISYEPPIKIDFYVHTLKGEKKLVLSKQLDEHKNEMDLRTKGTIDGYGLSYKIVGTGKVFDIVLGVTNEHTD